MLFKSHYYLKTPWNIASPVYIRPDAIDASPQVIILNEMQCAIKTSLNNGSLIE